jgi:hypothetical protein
VAGVGVEPVVTGGVWPQATSSINRRPLKHMGSKRRNRNEFIKSFSIKICQKFFYIK